MGFNELAQTEHAFFMAGQGGNTEQSLKERQQDGVQGREKAQ